MNRRPRYAIWRDLIAESNMDAAARPLAFLLALYMDGNGICWPSRRTLAKALGVTTRTIDRTVPLIETEGLLRAERSAGGRSNATNTYVALCPATASEKLRSQWDRGDAHVPPGATRVTRRGDVGDAKGRHSNVTRGSKKNQEGDDSAALGGASSSPNKEEPFAPEDDCPGCGVRASLVPPDFIYCAECQRGIDALLAERVTDRMHMPDVGAR